MKEVLRKYDLISRRTWITLECTECGSRNLTPTGNRQKGRYSVCHYICEVCKHSPEEEFVYAVDGTIKDDALIPSFGATISTEG